MNCEAYTDLRYSVGSSLNFIYSAQNHAEDRGMGQFNIIIFISR